MGAIPRTVRARRRPAFSFAPPVAAMSGFASMAPKQSLSLSQRSAVVRILFIGDVVGRPGRKATREYLEEATRAEPFDFVIANGENAAGGKGLTPSTAQALFQAGVHCLTGGNHIWKNRDVAGVIDDERVVRPANYPPGADTPGHGAAVLHSPAGFPVGVVNLLGRTYMDHHEDPFACAERLVARLAEQTPILIVDMHAEATSEKLAMFRLLDGRVTAVIGTHTHVQTADEQVSPSGTAYLTDAGMTGAHDSILGVKSDIILRQLRTGLPVRHELSKDDLRLCGLIVEVDPLTGGARAVERVCHPPWPTRGGEE